MTAATKNATSKWSFAVGEVFTYNNYISILVALYEMTKVLSHLIDTNGFQI